MSDKNYRWYEPLFMRLIGVDRNGGFARDY